MQRMSWSEVCSATDGPANVRTSSARSPGNHVSGLNQTRGRPIDDAPTTAPDVSAPTALAGCGWWCTTFTAPILHTSIS